MSVLTRFVLVTGMTGAGRGTAAKSLEKLGYYVIDNLPAELLEPAIEAIERSSEVSRLAIVVDARSGSFFAGLNDALQRLRERGIRPRVLYLEASDAVLVRRQEAARRPHPLSREGRLMDGYRRERKLLRRIRGRADIVIDTSNLNVHQLGQRMQAARSRIQSPKGCGSASSRSASSTVCRSTPTWSPTCGSCPIHTGSTSCDR